ncbi:MAG: AAA family ATPase [Myxococcota bacterium]
MAQLHLVVGPVGSGKSTFVAALCARERAVRLNLDDWMATLFRPDRPVEGMVAWYAERAERCVAQIWSLAVQLIEVGVTVVLEIGLIRRRDRLRLYGWVDERALDLTIHILDAPRDVRRARVQHRNETRGPTFTMVVPPEIFELASDMWEPLADDECEGRDVRFVATVSATPNQDTP